jgi:hypothetical protein
VQLEALKLYLCGATKKGTKTAGSMASLRPPEYCGGVRCCANWS